MAATNGKLVLCVEDELYRSYLEQEFAGAGTPCTSVAVENLAQTISESPSGILLLQSDTDEQNIIELSSRGSNVSSARRSGSSCSRRTT